VSIFSELNQLEDISMDRNYSDLCGITQAELEGYFEDDIGALARENNLD
jgi:hypothetical protein